MEFKISVTAEDIKNGLKANGDGCAVALAVKRAFCGMVPEAYVASRYLAMPTEIVRLPQKVQDFISHFDNGQKVRPFNFTLNIGLQFKETARVVKATVAKLVKAKKELVTA